MPKVMEQGCNQNFALFLPVPFPASSHFLRSPPLPALLPRFSTRPSAAVSLLSVNRLRRETQFACFVTLRGYL